MAARRDLLMVVVSTLCLSWLGMMACHELGHVLGAIMTEGRVLRVVLHPVAISRTDVSPNPSPLIVAWAGPILGCLIPLLLLLIVGGTCRPAQRAQNSHTSTDMALSRFEANSDPELSGRSTSGSGTLPAPPRAVNISVIVVLLQFFSGFCFVANGAYLGSGVFDEIGDAREILMAGSPTWLLVIFGLSASAAGLLMWHALGSPSLLLQSRNRFDPWLIRGLWGTLFLVVVVECLFSPT